MKLFNLFTLVSLSFFTGIISGCAGSEIGESKDVAQESIYQQYNISYNEEDEMAALSAQFRFAGNEGTTLVLTKPSSLKFDGIEIAVDSNDYEGAFYKKDIPVNNLCRAHHLVFTDINNKVLDNSFSLNAFKMVNVPENAVNNQELRLQFAPLNLQEEDHIELFSVDTDSSFSITCSAKDFNQFISISPTELKRQKGAQLKLSATLYKKVPLQQNTREGGALEIAYSLKPFTVNLLAERMLYTSN